MTRTPNTFPAIMFAVTASAAALIAAASPNGTPRGAPGGGHLLAATTPVAARSSYVSGAVPATGSAAVPTRRTEAAAGPAATRNRAEGSAPSAGAVEIGLASYYANSLAGQPTASGAPYDPAALTAAHRTLPLGTRVRVTNLSNGRKVEVVVNDRGPFVPGRVLDLSLAAAERLDFIQRGHARVRIEVLGRGDR